MQNIWDKDILRQCWQLYARGNMLLRKNVHVFYRSEADFTENFLLTNVYCSIVVELHSSKYT